jgi:hypothetical protein
MTRSSTDVDNAVGNPESTHQTLRTTQQSWCSGSATGCGATGMELALSSQESWLDVDAVCAEPLMPSRAKMMERLVSAMGRASLTVHRGAYRQLLVLPLDKDLLS